MAITYTNQHNIDVTGHANGGTDPGLLSISVTEGDFVWVGTVVLGVTVLGDTSVTDNQGNTYTADRSPEDVGFGALTAMGHRTIVQSTGTLNITVSVDAGSPGVAVFCGCLGFSGIATSSPFDKSAFAAGSSANPASGTTGTLSQADELIVGVTFTAGRTLTTTNDYIKAEQNDISLVYKIVSATTAENMTGTITSDDWMVLAETYKGAANVTLEQTHARWRNDDGNETTATWKAAEDANLTAPLDTIVRLRLQTSATDA